MVGITAYGAYVPRLRLQRAAAAKANAWLNPGLTAKAKGERAMGNWDEDAITMAVEAARDALGPGDDRSHISAHIFATTTGAFSDRLNAGIVSAALTLERNAGASDVTGSQRAGLVALSNALGIVAGAPKGANVNILVTAADKRRARAASTQELDFGDAGAAFVCGAEDTLADWIGGATATADFVDHFRGAGEAFDYHWEERWIRDEGFAKLVPPTIARALDNAKVKPEAVDTFILPSVFKGVAESVAKKLGIRPEAVRDNLAAQVGEAGCAHALVMLAHALESAKAGQVIVVAQFGQGCEVSVFRVTDRIADWRPTRGVSGWLADRKEETNYMKWLVFNGLVDWEKGMRSEKDNKTALTTLYRNNDMILGLVGGRCRETGTVQFPRTRISVNPNNATVDTQEPYKFAERAATVLTWSADHLTYAMSPPNHYGMMVFEGGGRIFMDITDVEPGDVESGTPVRMVFRVKEWDDRRGFTRYFWKAAPDRRRAASKVAAA
ncbi:MAG: 3-oxoacyl-[acyl-carrier-protein] synthase III C-terminal domain-containing protein [Hyphomonadaceae bacterium]|nr:3-oxoacyl-[acyl-carrier-protein] synthase III C-terminal domain-containing protein [Hyphomonadaceae bacterium]